MNFKVYQGNLSYRIMLGAILLQNGFKNKILPFTVAQSEFKRQFNSNTVE